jgi:hypothetical protein
VQAFDRWVLICEVLAQHHPLDVALTDGEQSERVVACIPAERVVIADGALEDAFPSQVGGEGGLLVDGWRDREAGLPLQRQDVRAMPSHHSGGDAYHAAAKARTASHHSRHDSGCLVKTGRST